MEFIKFVGHAWINGRSVAAYRDGDEIVLRAETSGGKAISPARRVSQETFEILEEQWGADVPSSHDARITHAALRWAESIDQTEE